MDAVAARKLMTGGEAGLTLVFIVTALWCLVAASQAADVPFAFHAYLGAAASCAAAFAIFNHYFDRPAGPPLQEIDGRPNYNFGPVKVAVIFAVFWGIAGFLVGLWAALELAWPALQLRFALDQFRPHPAAAYLGGDLRLRRQRVARDVLLCGAADLPGAARRRTRALVRGAGL